MALFASETVSMNSSANSLSSVLCPRREHVPSILTVIAPGFQVSHGCNPIVPVVYLNGNLEAHETRAVTVLAPRSQ